MQNFYQNQPILVTGGAGFIGSHVTELLVQAGAQVTVLDNFSTGTRENLSAVLKQITIVEQDIRDLPALLKLFQQHRFTAVFHLAAATSVPESQLDPALYHAINVTGTLNILTALQQVNAAQPTNAPLTRLIFSSSSAVYGNRTALCRETDPTAPTSIYGLSKLIGEQYCQLFSQSYQLPTICLRYFNVYGPRQNPAGQYAGVYAKFQHNLAHNLPITIYGTGQQARDFIAVTQVAQANLLAGSLPISQLTGQAVNIGSGQKTTVLELLTQLQANYPEYSNQITFAPARAGDVVYSQADIRHARLLKLVDTQYNQASIAEPW